MRMLTITAAALLAAGAARSAEPEGAAEVELRLRELFQDISTLNLLNGLRLTPDQSAKVLQLAREARAARSGEADGKRAAYLEAAREAVAAYEAFRAEAMKGEPPRGRVSAEATRQEKRLREYRESGGGLANERLAEIDEKLCQVLTEGQLQIVEGFKPCLIPPKDLRDPVRAGQVSGDRPVNALSRMRGIPQQVWEARRDEIASRQLAVVEKHAYRMVSDEERAAEKRRVIAVIEKARRMSDTDFELEKDALGAELRGENKLDQLRDEVRQRSTRTRGAKLSKAGDWLLSPRVIPILEERIRLAAAGR